MSASIFQQPAAAGFFDVDPRLRFSPTAYWRTLQNAAAAHAAQLGAATEELRRQGQTWMLSRMILEIDRHPELGERMVVETWPSTKLRGVRAVRDFVLREESGAVLARSSSLWVIVDLATRKPLRVPDAIADLRTDPGYAIPEFSAALETPTEFTHERRFTAEWSDADQNEHVNNVSYVRWAVDALPVAFLETHALRSMEVHYLKEIQVGESVEVRSLLEGSVARQVLVNSAGELAAAFALQWVTCPAVENS